MVILVKNNLLVLRLDRVGYSLQTPYLNKISLSLRNHYSTVVFQRNRTRKNLELIHHQP